MFESLKHMDSASARVSLASMLWSFVVLPVALFLIFARDVISSVLYTPAILPITIVYVFVMVVITVIVADKFYLFDAIENKDD